MKRFVLIAFGLNLAFTGVCMMPMADAAAMPMQRDAHQEMVATPMNPMTPAHCEHCAEPENNKEQSPCNGHCFSQGDSARLANLVFGSAPVIAALPAISSPDWDVNEHALALPTINESPPGTSTNSVVLRL